MLVLKILYKLAIGFVSYYALIFLLQIFWRFSIPEQLLLVILGLWLIPLLSLEIVWLWRKRKPFPRFLTHLRYAPIAIFSFFIIFTLSFDWAMIQHSKYKIRDYVYGNTPAEQKIEFELHNNYRGWCGNGYPANEYWLYSETAAEGFSSSDAAVRARSLRASIELYDWLNGVSDGPFPQLIKQAEQDENELVKKIASEFRKSRDRR